jgi:SAM-dependent methyltransferase
MLTKAEQAAVSLIKRKISFMLEERAKMAGPEYQTAGPSEYWSDFCRNFRYLLGMQDQDFDLLRIHTYHLDADTYQGYYFASPSTLKRYADYEGTTDYDSLVHGLPEQYLLSAPQCLGEYGLPVDGRIVNMTLMRMQRVVRTLYFQNVLPALIGRRATVLEIGGGYGCLAYHLSRILENSTYVIVDLPETLLYSAVYLTIAAPQKRVLLWDRNFKNIAAEDFDFVLVPNYALDDLANLQFDCTVNVASFQELASEQLDTYLDFVRAHSKCLYSWNRDVQDRNTEAINVTRALKARFDLTLIDPPARLPQPELETRVPPAERRPLIRRARRFVRRMLEAVGQRQPETPPSPAPVGWAINPYREYICAPAHSAADAPSAPHLTV